MGKVKEKLRWENGNSFLFISNQSFN